jgi:hypothetical protein
MKKTLLMLALVAGITSSAQNAQAALISINIGVSGFNIGGDNGGVANGFYAPVNNFPISSNSFLIANNYFGDYGLVSIGGGITFATGADPATPVNFALNQLIDSSSGYSINTPSLFQSTSSFSPDFGLGSYMGFQTSQGNYGWLEVTWTASSQQFQILSGAYESEAGVGIRAGAGGPGPAAVPEPGTWAAAALLAGGAAFMRWRKRKQVS